MALAEQKNKQIIEAAIAEFQEKGFAGASMDRISERAQVSKRTVYNHFESKEALFKAITECLAGRVQSYLHVSFDPKAPIRDELIRLGWSQGKLLTDPCAMSMVKMVLGEVLRDPDLASHMNKRMEMVMIIKTFLDATVKSGHLNIPDTLTGAEQFLGLIKARGFYPKMFGEAVATHEEMERIIEETVDMFLSRYGTGKA
ncbi:TetR/AcrR family transcriptional regulator [Roseibium suaedae]|uniref:Transcriptional regulator, TetR family n=1 Tax=Roseibium suaedae TaxID=735517 RepID=A0A1M7MJ33_9HYPH|nr:TetR/AcrR family transcriptional regulator [Roseibium suaedae]SHM90953.1 transcriptional regulator, TetR family [Roseibium suaedae]